MAGINWNIERYARFRKDSQKESCNSSLRGKEWQHIISSQTKPILIAIKKPLNVILQAGTEILESFTLLQSSKWLKVIARDDNMLFFYRSQIRSASTSLPAPLNNVRRFRIKFGRTQHKSSKHSCAEFVEALSPHVYVQVVDGNSDSSQLAQSQSSTLESSTPPPIGKENESNEIISVAKLTKIVVSEDLSTLPSYYRSTNLKLDESEPSLIKTCLLDPNFPGFVEEVESHLKEMMSD